MRDLKYMYFNRLEKILKVKQNFIVNLVFFLHTTHFICKTTFSLLTFDHQFIIKVYIIVLNPSLFKEKPKG